MLRRSVVFFFITCSVKSCNVTGQVYVEKYTELYRDRCSDFFFTWQLDLSCINTSINISVTHDRSNLFLNNCTWGRWLRGLNFKIVLCSWRTQFVSKASLHGDFMSLFSTHPDFGNSVEEFRPHKIFSILIKLLSSLFINMVPHQYN
jgi:hypothetical protein